MGIGKNIAKYRQERGMTQNELSSLANVHENYLAAIEEEKSVPHIKAIARIASHLGVTIDELIGEDEN